jgi:hypothetical protein
MLHGEQGRNFVVPQDDFAFWIQNESDVEEAIGPFWMMRLGLSHDESVVLAGDCAQRAGFRSRNVDRAVAGELGVIQVQYLVIETLQSAFRQSYQSHRKVKA